MVTHGNRPPSESYRRATRLAFHNQLRILATTGYETYESKPTRELDPPQNKLERGDEPNRSPIGAARWESMRLGPASSNRCALGKFTPFQESQNNRPESHPEARDAEVYGETLKKVEPSPSAVNRNPQRRGRAFSKNRPPTKTRTGRPEYGKMKDVTPSAPSKPFQSF